MARKKEDIAEDGRATRFSSTNQPANRGRKKSLYTQFKEMAKSNNTPLSREDFCKIVSHLPDQPSTLL